MRKARYLWSLKIVLLSACAGGDDFFSADMKAAPARDAAPPEIRNTLAASNDAAAANDSRPSSQWQEMHNVSGAKLHGVWASSPADVFAVGAKGVIMHYDGQAWTQMASGTASNLYGVWGFGPSDVFAVGESVILRYNGQQWERIKSYPSNIFYAVWGLPPDELWITAPGGLIFYKMGRDTLQMIDLPAEYAVHYYAVWGLPSGEVLIAGENGKALKGRGFSFSPMPETGIKSALHGIWGSAADNIYAVGEEGTLIHYDGLAWHEILASDSYFYGVWGNAPDNVFVVGHSLFKPDESIFHFDGKKWAKMPPPTSSPLNAVFGLADKNIFVVGNYSILRYVP